MRATLNRLASVRWSAAGQVVGWVITLAVALVTPLTACEGGGAGGGGPRVDGVTPGTGSARGGEGVRVIGAGFDDGTRVWFGGAEATVTERVSEGELRVTTPLHLAGRVDVVARDGDGGEARRADAFTFEPLELRFVEAAPHYLPRLETLVITDLVVADLDLDGLSDLVIANLGAVNRLYTGTASGRFLDRTPALPLQSFDSVAAIVLDADGDGDLDVLVADSDGQGLKLYVSVPPVGVGPPP
jgi:hypothetical protein